MPHVTCLVHLYPPTHNAGAEWMLHSILTELATYGWTSTVVCTRPPRRHDIFEGVEVVMAQDGRRQADAIRRADVCITHLDATRALLGHTTRRLRRPVVHLVHNDSQLAFHGVEPGPGRADLVVWNSRWIADAHPDWQGPSMVVHPPVWLDRYRTPGAGDAVTLLNLAERKGSATFYELARRFPDHRFLGVRGAYAAQDVPKVLPPNVEVLPNQRDARRVYAQTSVLLMPSHYESWGRCAVEAAASSIPTLAAPTPGLVETEVPVGFADPADIDLWVTLLEALLTDPEARAAAGARALLEAERLQFLSRLQVEALDRVMRALADQRPSIPDLMAELDAAVAAARAALADGEKCPTFDAGGGPMRVCPDELADYISREEAPDA